MNCRLGDLAIVVNDLDYPINNGCLLVVIAHAPTGAFSIPADWVCRPLSTFNFNGRWYKPDDGRTVVYRDCELRPLRDSESDDETLAWAKTPSSTHGEKDSAMHDALAATTQPTSFLRATVQHAQQFFDGSWSLSVICGEIGFDVRVPASVMPQSGLQPGDRIHLEYKKGDDPLLGPFIKVSVLNG